MGVCPKCKLDPTVIYCTVDAEGKHQSFNGMPSQVKKMMLDVGGESYSFTWHVNDLVHREKLPAKIAFNSESMFMHWYDAGRRHRLGGPAAINEGLDSDWWMQGLKEMRVLVQKRDWKPFDDLVNPKISQSNYHKENVGNYIHSLKKLTLVEKVEEGEGYQMWEALEHDKRFCFVRLVFE